MQHSGNWFSHAAALICRPLTAALLLGLGLNATSVQAATFTVKNVTDPASGTAANCAANSGGTCTLRDAISAAGSGDTIQFSGDMQIKLTSNTTLTLSHSVTIDATGHNVTVDGNAAVTVFYVSSGATVQITHLTIADGSTSNNGGGIYNQGTLKLTDSFIANNNVTGNSANGGGIFNTGTLTLTNSTVANNRVDGGTGGFGGGIYNGGTLTLTNSTLSSNAAVAGINNNGNPNPALGGGIYNTRTLTLTNSTLFGNNTSSSSAGPDVYNNFGFAKFINTIVASDCDGNARSGPVVLDGGGNIDGGTGCGFTNTTSHSNVTNLNLGSLQNNGGPTPTVLPQAGSAAINAVVCANAPPTDQRGLIRPDPGSAGSATPCDIGAVEVGSIPDEIFANGCDGTPTP